MAASTPDRPVCVRLAACPRAHCGPRDCECKPCRCTACRLRSAIAAQGALRRPGRPVANPTLWDDLVGDQA